MPKCDFNKVACRSVISIKMLYNFVEITLRYGFSPVNLWHIFRTLFCKNSTGGLLLNARLMIAPLTFMKAAVHTIFR